MKEGIGLSQESKSSEKFFHGIKVLMAKNYIDNLSEEARKGQQEMAEQGIWPTKAPLGYRNVLGTDGKRAIAPDPEVAAVTTKMFEWYAPGTLSLEQVTEKALAEGLSYRRTGAPVPVSAVPTILHNRIYTGEFVWKGRIYKGRHTPLISVELFERVQYTLAGRRENEQPMEKRRLLNFVVSNSTWADGELKATLREPFGFIAKMAKFTSGGGSENGASFADRSGWLGN